MNFTNRLLWFGILLIGVSTAASVVLAYCFGGLNPTVSAIALLSGGFTGLVAWRRIDKTAPEATWADALLLGVFALVCLRAMIWVVYAAGGEWRVLSPNNVGDASLHITLINYLAGGEPFWPESPILAGTPLAYPLGTDLFNALLASCGVPLISGLVWVGLGCSLLTGLALWRWGGAFVIAAFLFNGGLAGLAFFTTWKFEDYQSLLAWKNIFLSMFVTQRGLLYTIPAGLALLVSWQNRMERGRGIAPLWAEVFVYSTLPLFSVHGFLFFSLLLAGGLFVPSFRIYAVKLVAWALIPATICMMLSTAFFSMPSHIRWQPGWMEGGDTLWFWIHNFGVSLPLWIWVAAYLTFRGFHGKEHVAGRYFVWGGGLLFLTGVCVMLTPWEWDNMKVLFWTWLAAAPFIWRYAIQPLHPVARVAICLLLFTSGAVSLIGGLDKRHGYRIASIEELHRVTSMARSIPATDRIATAPIYNHPLLLLGRKAAVGYDGHLWSHGLDYGEQMAALKELYQTKQPRQTPALPGTKWLYFGSEERKAFPHSPLYRAEDYFLPLKEADDLP